MSVYTVCYLQTSQGEIEMPVDHRILRMPGLQPGTTWMSCMTCDQVLARAAADPDQVERGHRRGQQGAPVRGTRLFVAPQGTEGS